MLIATPFAQDITEDQHFLYDGGEGGIKVTVIEERQKDLVVSFPLSPILGEKVDAATTGDGCEPVRKVRRFDTPRPLVAGSLIGKLVIHQHKQWLGHWVGVKVDGFCIIQLGGHTTRDVGAVCSRWEFFHGSLRF